MDELSIALDDLKGVICIGCPNHFRIGCPDSDCEDFDCFKIYKSVEREMLYRIPMAVEEAERPRCPKCNQPVNVKKKDGKHIYEYCKCCGQALKWWDSNEIE